MSNHQTMQPLDPEQEEQRRERRAMRAVRRKQRFRARFILWSTITVSTALLVAMGYFYLQIQSTLAYNAGYPAINNITCDSTMHDTGYHIHVHVSIFVNGHSDVIPQAVGMAPDLSCFYWLHTHTSDGILHVEAPDKSRILYLSDFFTIWHERFASMSFPAELTQSTGWKIYIDGKPFASPVTSPLTTKVALTSHEIITLEYGNSNPPPDTSANYKFPANLSQ